MKGSFPMWHVASTEDNIKLWFEQLQSYTVRDLRRAYGNIINSGANRPPSLSEIKALCRGRTVDAMRRSADLSGSAKSLPPPPKANPKKAEENVSRLRRMVAGVEPAAQQHCKIGHLSPALKRAFREGVAGRPTIHGVHIDPKYAPPGAAGKKYLEEIEEWNAGFSDRKENEHLLPDGDSGA